MEALRFEGTDPESHRNTAKRDLGLIPRLLLLHHHYMYTILALTPLLNSWAHEYLEWAGDLGRSTGQVRT